MMRGFKVISSSILLLVLMGREVQCKESNSPCTKKVRGASRVKWSSLKGYAREISSGLNNTLLKQSANYEKGKNRWSSICPVEKEPTDKRERTGVALKVFLALIPLLKENERKIKESFLFYTCNEAETSLTNLTETACYLLSGLPNNSPSAVVNISNVRVEDLNITDSLEVFQRFSECVATARRFKNVSRCADPVFGGCNNGDKKKKGRGRKGRKGKGRKGKGKKGRGKGKKGKGRRKGKKGGKRTGDDGDKSTGKGKKDN